MDPDDQSDTIAFLTDPATYAVDREAVETRRTHISLVVLAGSTALKLKLAVKLPYLDFSSAVRRLQDCEREVAPNRRTAPAIYRGIRRITLEADGRLMFDGSGPMVDAVVEMRRFDDGALFEHLAKRHVLTAPMLDALAGEIARLHASATLDTRRGGAETVRAVLAINERAFAGANLFRAEEVSRLNAAFRSALDLHAPLLDRRGETGRIRLCHGDLHLRNICLIDGAPVLFDCLEFDDALATMDTLYDLAFLLMDLWHRGLRAEANRVFNRYFDIDDDTDGLPLLPFFMALRAAVRAHVGATRARRFSSRARRACGRGGPLFRARRTPAPTRAAPACRDRRL